MPVTTKFSEQFYAKLGHGVAEELVDWFNKVDSTYRSDFKDLFAAHFGTLDAKLGQRVGVLDTKWDRALNDLHVKIDRQVGELNVKIDQLNAKMDHHVGERPPGAKPAACDQAHSSWLVAQPASR